MKQAVIAFGAAILSVSRVVSAAEPASVDEVDALTGQFDGNLHTRAHEVSFDTRQKRLELSGDVEVDAAPFHLRSDRIVLTRTRLGIEIEGDGTLAFCPCLGTPLTVDFTAALVAPPGDVILTDPTVRIYGLPVFYLPYFWLRSEDKIGVLPPDLAYRGTDGFFVGEGVHLPFRNGTGKSAIDLRGGAYLVDGLASDLRVRTPAGLARIHYDRLHGDDGLSIDARGASHGVSWDVDAIRGTRGVYATTELDAAAKPWDRGAIEGTVRGGQFIAETRVRSVSRRGGGTIDFDAVGPSSAVRYSDGRVGFAWDGSVEGRSLRTPGESFSFARAELGVSGASHLGPVGASVAVRGVGDLHAERDTHGLDHALSARWHLGVPLARGFGADLVHVVEPFAEVAALAIDGTSYVAGPIQGAVSLAEAGLRTSFGSWATRDAVDLSVSGGGIREGRDVHGPIARGRVAMSTLWAGLSFDGGYANDGIALAVHGRLGARESLHLLGHVATRSGPDPVLARALTDAPLEPATGFLATEGTTTGGALAVPFGARVTASGGADVDATRVELVAVYGGLQLHDRCNCVTLRANAAHRIGRSGVDAWLGLDFTPNR